MRAVMSVLVFCAVACGGDHPSPSEISRVGDYRVRTLANGLTVYSAHDANTSNVTVQVWYKVGSKDDPAGRSGFAHLFEHLMFKGTRNLPSEAFDRLTEDVGGANNASTWDDTTNYYEVLPANELQRVLFAEADRMASLVLDQSAFESEREVVKEELRMRVLAEPYGRLFTLYVPQEAYQEHPYRRPGIGSIEQLDAAKLEEVRAFHRTYYRPDQAYLIVIGAIDDAQLDGWVDRYFAPIARPERPVPTNDVSEPPRTAAGAADYYAPNISLPAVVLNWPAPRVADEDSAAFAVLDNILSSGFSSRLYQDLSYLRPLAVAAGTILSQRQQAGDFSMYAVLASSTSVAEGAAALAAQAAQLRDAPVRPEELEQAKHELSAAALRQRETVQGRGQLLGHDLIMSGDATRSARHIERIRDVSADDIQRIARTYLTPDTTRTINYLPDAAKPEGSAPEPRAIALDAPVQLEDLAPAGPAIERAPDAERLPLPASGPEPAVTTPELSERRLRNGLRVVVAPARDVPLASVQLSFPVGATADPLERPGLASMTARLVGEGTRDMSSPELARAIEDLGASLSSDVGYDFTHLYANGPSEALDRLLTLLSGIAIHPALDEADLARVKLRLSDGSFVGQADISGIADSVVGRLVYGSARYGDPLGGTARSLTEMSSSELALFHARHWRPGVATLIVTGDVEPDATFAIVERLFGEPWQDRGDPDDAAVADPAGPVVPARTIAIDLPMAGQAAVLAAERGVARNDPAYYPLLLANQVLGGGFSARLNKQIRVERGLTYGASSQIATRLDDGYFVASAQTRNEAAVEVARLMLAEIGRMSSELVSQEELVARRAVLVGELARRLETVDGLASSIAGVCLYGLPLSELRDYASKVRGVTPEQIQEVASRSLTAAGANLVVVGDLQLFAAELQDAYPGLELIPIQLLRPDQATLH